MSPTLDVVIVNWNSGRQLRECLQSVVSTGKASFRLSRVVVVDNKSSDVSLEGLAGLELPLTIIANNSNRGFAAACNQGARGSEADYVLILNPDIRLFDDSLDQPLDFMERPSGRSVGILGIQLVDSEGRVSRTCSRFPTPRTYFWKMVGLSWLFPTASLGEFMTDWPHRDSREVDQVMGAFFLVRRRLFESLGGFDERFFVYFEEVDFSLRARKAGWASYYLAEARAYHKGAGTTENVRSARLFYNLRSRIRYGYKHFGWWSGTALLLGTLLLEPLG